MSKYTRGLLAVILAVVLVLPAAAFAMLPEANARSSTGMDGPKATKVVDYDTSNHWKFWAGGYDGKEVTTQNVGRIWTDKTVKETAANEESDFLTTLSAISSTSDTTVSGKPLDIVLVLDASGSMNDPMGGGDSPQRIVALKNAASSFIGTIAKQNEKIKDESKQHQVAIVKFAGKKKSDEVGNDKYREGLNTYNYSQTMQKLTACSGNGAKSLKETINSITPAGATHADYGLQLAEGISSGRADAKKVVVFFTDGSPTSWDGFENEVANDAINSAKKIKDKGADIYTIGIFSGVNPSDVPTADDTSKENKFMHAVSSNYPVTLQALLTRIAVKCGPSIMANVRKTPITTSRQPAPLSSRKSSKRSREALSKLVTRPKSTADMASISLATLRLLTSWATLCRSTTLRLSCTTARRLLARQ